MDVSVYNAGASAADPADRSRYLAPVQAPTVTGRQPRPSGSTAGGTLVTITGTNLTGASASIRRRPRAIVHGQLVDLDHRPVARGGGRPR